jgi:CheY-like chemotaxis protein
MNAISPHSPSSQVSTVRDRILIVDDMADNIFLLETILEGEGFQVEAVDSGRAALDKIISDPPDLLLLDVMMPEMNGFEVTQQIRQNPNLPFIPILLITGYLDPTPAEGFDVGADDFIRKPIDIDELLSRVRAILQPEETVVEGKSGNG